MNEPYVKTLGKRGPLQLLSVDGEYVRDNYRAYKPSGEAFTNAGQHFQFGFIPYYEAWLDEGIADDDLPFLIDNVCCQWLYMKQGDSYETAIAKATAVERRERRKAGYLWPSTKGADFTFVQECHKAFLGTILGNVYVWLAHGDMVRRRDLTWTEGGHGLVYRSFTPRFEIWLDDQIRPDERPKVLIHEASEYQRMANGMKYNQAHNAASNIEFAAREDPAYLKMALQELGWQGQVEKAKAYPYWR